MRLLLFLCCAVAASASELLPRARVELAHFETGARTESRCAADRMIGAAGEVSRYQILPSEWARVSSRKNYDDPAAAWIVARRILSERMASFSRVIGREPRPIELYLLWNAPGAFRKAGYDAARVSSRLHARAQRFANLMP